MKIIFLLLFLLSGCFNVNDKDILTYDSEKAEKEQMEKIKQAQTLDPFKGQATKDHVRVAEDEDNDIFVEVHKGQPLKGYKGIILQVWHIMATNNGDKSKCISIKWELQNFEYESSLPSEFVLKAHSKLNIGKIRQTIWAFDDVMLALPPSGYASGLTVRDVDTDKKGKEECQMDESFIDNV